MIRLLLILILTLHTITLFSQDVEIIGDLKLNNGSQGEGKILVSDSDGVSTWMS